MSMRLRALLVVLHILKNSVSNYSRNIGSDQADGSPALTDSFDALDTGLLDTVLTGCIMLVARVCVAMKLGVLVEGVHRPAVVGITVVGPQAVLHRDRCAEFVQVQFLP